MHHVATPPRRHRDRAQPTALLCRAPAQSQPGSRRLGSLDAVALQVIVGFTAPLPIIQLGHWMFGWTSVAVMFGGQ